MVTDWIRQNLTATIAAVAVGTASIGGVTYFLVQPGGGSSSPSHSNDAGVLVPARFSVHVAGVFGTDIGGAMVKEIKGEGSFLCDTTVRQDRSCLGNIFLHPEGARFPKLYQVGVAPHAGDPTRVAINFRGRHEGVPYAALEKGVTFDGTTFSVKSVQ